MKQRNQASLPTHPLRPYDRGGGLFIFIGKCSAQQKPLFRHLLLMRNTCRRDGAELRSNGTYAIISPRKRGCLYDEDPIRLLWQDFPEFRKVLVPLRKFAFLNLIYQRFTNENGEPNLQ